MTSIFIELIMNMKMAIVLVIFALTLSLGAQETKLPPFIRTSEDKPGTDLVGKVRMVLTSTYLYDELRETTATTYGSNLEVLLIVSHSRLIEPHSDRLLDSDQNQRYFYDEKTANLIRTISSNDNSEKSFFTNYVYDAKNRLIEKLFFDDRKQLDRKTKFDYSQEKKEVKTTIFLVFDGREAQFRTRVFEYDDKLMWTKRTEFDRQGKEVETISYEYDARGFLVKKTFCCNNKNTRLFTYKWDKFGNWVDRMESQIRSTSTGKTTKKELTRDHRVIVYND